MVTIGTSCVNKNCAFCSHSVIYVVHMIPRTKSDCAQQQRSVGRSFEYKSRVLSVSHKKNFKYCLRQMRGLKIATRRFRLLVVSLSERRLGFNPSLVLVRFEVGKVTME